MARYTSPFHLSGSIGAASFADNNGTPTARMRSGMSTHRWKTHEHLQPARDHAYAFGGASKLAAGIHRQLDNDMRRLLGAHTHNRLTKAILDAAPRAGARCRVPAFPAARSTAALRQLDLGHLPKDGRPPIASTQHHHHLEKVTVHGLRRLRDTIQLKPGEFLEYRLLTLQVRVPGSTADPDNPGRYEPDPQAPDGTIHRHTGEWDSALSLPETLELPAPHHDNTVLIIGIEWRAIKGLRLRYFPKHNVLRIAAAHTGSRPQDLEALRPGRPKRKPRPKSGRRRTPPAPISLTPREAKAARQRLLQAQLALKPPLVLA